MTRHKIAVGIVLLVLGISTLAVYKPLRDDVLKLLHKIGLTEEVCTNAEIVGDVALPVYKCSYRLKSFPFISYCHIGWSGNHCHFIWEGKHIH